MQSVVIVAGLAVAWSRTKEALVADVVPTAVCFFFFMPVLRVSLLVSAACVASGSPSPWALFPSWLAPCCAIEHTFGFDIPVREALDCIYTSFAMAGLEVAQLVAAAYVESARSFLLAFF